MCDSLEWRREAFETGFGDRSLSYDRRDEQEGCGEFPLKKDIFGQDEKGAEFFFNLRGRACGADGASTASED